MSFQSAICCCLIVSCTFFPTSAGAQSSEVALASEVAELQKKPDDNALRRKIIAEALEMKPSPQIPEEARRHFVKADTLVRNAKSAEEFEPAIGEYREALLKAPWWGNAYHDAAVALEKASHYEEATAYLKLYLLTRPAENDIRLVQDEIYRIEAKQEQAARERPLVESRFGYILGTWHWENHWAGFDFDGEVEFRLSADGKMIEGMYTSNQEPGPPSPFFIRARVSGDTLKWEIAKDPPYRIGDPDDRCPLNHGWQPVQMKWKSEPHTFQVDEQTHEMRTCKPGEIFIVQFKR